MSWTIGVSTGCYYPFRSMESALYAIADMGFEVAELFVQTPSEYTALFGRRVLRALMATGLRLHSVHLHSKDLDPFAPYPPRRADAEALFRQGIALAQAVQAPVVNWHGATQAELAAGLPRERLWELVARWQGWAEAAGVALTLENVSWCALRQPDEVVEARQQVPTLQFTFDSFQAAESGCAPDALAQAMAGRIATAHLSDFAPGGTRHLVPGRGHIAWPTLLHTLAEGGYRGPLLIEVSHLDEECIGPALREARDFLEALIRAEGLHLRPTP